MPLDGPGPGPHDLEQHEALHQGRGGRELPVREADRVLGAAAQLGDVDRTRIAHAVHDAPVGEPLEQRLHVVEVGRRLLADDGLAAAVGVDAQERLEDAALGAIGGEQVGLDVLARDLGREPAPVGAQLAQSRATLQLPE